MSDNMGRVNVAELIADRDKLRRILWDNGFRRCDVPACNCDSWHPHGGFYARFREIDEAVGDHNGKTLLRAVEEMRDELADLRAENERLRKRDDAITFDFQSLCDVIACKSPECGDLLCGACDVVDRLARTDAELADLRAYKERTEAGLQELRDFMRERWGKAADEPKWEFIDSLDAKGCDLGLWRDPPQAEVQP